jgi:hypothetical protein
MESAAELSGFLKKEADVPARKVGEKDEAGGAHSHALERSASGRPEVPIVTLTESQYTVSQRR